VDSLLDQVERLAARGLSQKQVCEALGISESWWHEKKPIFPELLESYKRGAALGLADVSNALYESAMSGTPVAQIFYLKNRAPNEGATCKASTKSKSTFLGCPTLSFSMSCGRIRDSPLLSLPSFLNC
jgi:hypothetical protein